MKLKEVEVYEVDVDVDGRLVKNSNNDDTGQQQQQQQQQRRQQQTTTTTSQPASQLIDGPDITHRFVLAYSLQYSIQCSQGLASGIYDPGPETTRTVKLNERRACRYHPGRGVRYRECRYTKITHDDGQWRGQADRSDLALTLILWDKESCTTRRQIGNPAREPSRLGLFPPSRVGYEEAEVEASKCSIKQGDLALFSGKHDEKKQQGLAFPPPYGQSGQMEGGCGVDVRT
ncbi:hypothetical protein TESG_04546 [Trichophyton tonsurans CBS 112818]|uniref:Uncharacterized protein n=1 Tax=Trichophyton tonsurans (strain CBS 112818) TaxID=647933 RepID=F2S0N3_TRIT1|nr:hypothetical protein TESG_04546 [Trichophyton tonsurans CBS 112818]